MKHFRQDQLPRHEAEEVDAEAMKIKLEIQNLLTGQSGLNPVDELNTWNKRSKALTENQRQQILQDATLRTLAARKAESCFGHELDRTCLNGPKIVARRALAVALDQFFHFDSTAFSQALQEKIGDTFVFEMDPSHMSFYGQLSERTIEDFVGGWKRILSFSGIPPAQVGTITTNAIRHLCEERTAYHRHNDGTSWLHQPISLDTESVSLSADTIRLLSSRNFISDQQVLEEDDIQSSIISFIDFSSMKGEKIPGHVPKRQYIDGVARLLAAFPFSTAHLEGSQLQEMAESIALEGSKTALRYSGRGKWDTATTIANRFLPNTGLIQRMGIEGMATNLSESWPDIHERREVFALSDQDCVEGLSLGFKRALLAPYRENDPNSLIKKIDQIAAMAGRDVTQKAAQEAFLGHLQSGEMHAVLHAHRLLDALGRVDEVYASVQVEQAFVQMMLGCLARFAVNDCYQLLNLCSAAPKSALLERVLSTPSVVTAAQAFVSSLIVYEGRSGGLRPPYTAIQKARAAFHLKTIPIEEPQAQEIIQQRIKHLLVNDRGNDEGIAGVFEQFPLPAAIMERSGLKRDVQRIISTRFAQINSNLSSVEDLARAVGVSDMEMRGVINSAFEELGAGGALTVDTVPALIQRLRDLLERAPDQGESAAAVLTCCSERALKSGDSDQIQAFFTLCKDSALDQLPAFLPALDTNAYTLIEKGLLSYIPHLGDKAVEKKIPTILRHARNKMIAQLANDVDLADYFLENLGKYAHESWASEALEKAVTHYSVAKKYNQSFQLQNSSWAKEVWAIPISKKAQKIISAHDEAAESGRLGSGREGFRDVDPFKDHPWNFDREKIGQVELVHRLMKGEKLTEEEWTLFLGHQTHGVGEVEFVRSKKSRPIKTGRDALREWELSELDNTPSREAPRSSRIQELRIRQKIEALSHKLEGAYETFLNQVRDANYLNRDDKRALLKPETCPVRMTSLCENIKSFVARYIVQRLEGRLEQVANIDRLYREIERIVLEGFKRYLKIHEVDVPLYDKLYAEFDALRETGRYPLEVYLGRDGIYAYIGRRAQDMARRRKLQIEGRKRLRNGGEMVEIHPKYLVYPRYFRDNLAIDVKELFLQQEQVSPDADPLFYDTGYTGTIPEQIMKIMGFQNEEIESRIRLLSAPSAHRRVKGVDENARTEIIEYIEHNAKTEATAEGLLLDPETGRIRHVAPPTSPEEQFYFMMIKQALGRHYWLQEQIHYQPPEIALADGERRTIPA